MLCGRAKRNRGGGATGDHLGEMGGSPVIDRGSHGGDTADGHERRDGTEGKMPDSNLPAEPRPRTPRYGEGRPALRAGGRPGVEVAFEELLGFFTTHLDQV